MVEKGDESTQFFTGSLIANSNGRKNSLSMLEVDGFTYEGHRILAPKW